jgi:multidrug efflux pump subunit AcrA (membrane-fusion protein)
VGQRATLTVGAYPGEEFPGRVARIGAVFDPDSGTARAEIEVDNPDGRLRPGTFGTITIALGDSQQALLVPEAAVLESEGRSYVFVLAEQAPAEDEAPGADAAPAPGLAARRVEVRPLGSTPADAGPVRTAVDGPLEARQQVITLGHENLADGAPVVLAESGSAEPTAGQPADEVAE